MTKRTGDPAPLSTRRVFVLHLGAADPECGVLEGRIEHVASGRTVRFRRSEELIAFLAETDESTTNSGPAARNRRL